ncbi:MAG: dihydroorotase [Saprospiraceae bacterium]|nr:dihydroorotase [Saprospiraceae bacterium]
MQLLLKQVKIIDPTSSNHQQVKDILIEDGVIQAIRNSITKDVETVKVEGACVSPGWMDIGAYVGEPGFEQDETLETLSAAASRGGYTSVAVLPNTRPALHSKSEINFILKNAGDFLTEIIPLGAVTRDCAGEDMAELIDMRKSGALAFTDGKHPIQNAGILLRAFEYVRTFDGIVLNHPHQSGVSPEGLIHEGPVSVSLGLRGLPDVMEVMMLKRDIDLLRYSDSRLHVHNISSALCLPIIAAAKEEGLNVTCSVPALNLEAPVDRIADFNVNYKVLPPLRTEKNRLSLIEALKDGVIDFVTANHRPVDVETKKVEFPYADFGISSLETTFGSITKAFGRNRNLTLIVEALAINNRNIFGLDIPSVERGKKAELTIFHSGLSTTYLKQSFGSKSKNNPYLDQELPGKVLGVINKDRKQLFIPE